MLWYLKIPRKKSQSSKAYLKLNEFDFENIGIFIFSDLIVDKTFAIKFFLVLRFLKLFFII